jgi:O-antigen/teichoic acid export membrane protein
MSNHTVNLKTIALSVCPSFLRKYWDQIEASPQGLRLAKAAFWSLAGAIISRGFALLSSIIVARFLGKEGFGELGILQSTVGMFQVFAGLGLGLTATKYVAEYRIKDPQKAGQIIALSNFTAVASGAVIMLILFTLSPWLASHMLAAPHLAKMIRIGSIMLFLGALNGTQIGVLSGFEAFMTIARINLIAGILSFPLVVGGVYLGGLEGAVWGLTVSMGVNWFLNRGAIKRETHRACVPLAYAGCIDEWRILGNFSLPAVLSSVMVASANWLCNAMLVNQPSGYAALGIFGAADKWSQLLLFLPSSVSLATLSILSNLYGTKDIDSYKKIFKTNLMINLGIILGPTAGLILFSHVAMTVYGAEYYDGWITLTILSAATIPIVLNNLFGQILVSSGLIWWRFGFDFVLALLIVLFSWWLIPIHRENGLALASFIAFAVVVLILLIPTRHTLKCAEGDYIENHK